MTQIKDDSNQDFYDIESDCYDDTRWVSKSGQFTNAVQQKIVGQLTRQWTQTQVLEVGPGTARFTIPLARAGNRMTLLDISSGMLETAYQNLVEAGLNDQVVERICASLYEAPVSDEQFDNVICLNVLSHLDDGGRAIQQLARVVRPGGSLLLNFPNLNSYYWPAARRISKRGTAVDEPVFSKWERPKQIRRWLKAAQMDLVSHVGHVHVPRALERYRLLPLIRVLDAISRRAPLKHLAPVSFYLCRKES